MHMKENIKIFVIALIIGMAIAFFLSFKFQDDVALAINPEVTYFYVDSYNRLEDAKQKAANYPNSVIYQNGSIYQIVIGVYHDTEVIALMSSYFHDQNISFYQETMKVDSSFFKDISTYELLIKSSDASYYESVNTSMLQLFREYMPQNF